jgi:peptidoglycan/xylan/chitin deacetylase (PgdA/CDA1 family)
VYFTTSWDDGHPLDMRLADLLARFGFSATIYVPGSNREGLPVMTAEQLRQLDAQFEIGSHTLDHSYANRMSSDEWRSQVVKGKTRLEDDLGHAVAGFCYPGGKMEADSRDIVFHAGFEYARSVENFWMQSRRDMFLMPTSLQFYPHSRSVLTRNFLRGRHWSERRGLWLAAMSANDLQARLRRCLTLAIDADSIFHLWGHSWEIEAIKAWKILEEFLAYAADHVPADCRITNGELAKKMGASAVLAA